MNTHIYTPIIKGKQYDLRALGGLLPEDRAQIKPLIELPPVPGSSNVDAHLAKFMKNFTRYAGTGNLFLDFYGFLPGQLAANGLPATIAGYRMFASAGIVVTPVYGFERDDDLWPQLQIIVQRNGSGFCFRLEEDDIEVDRAEFTWESILLRSAQLGIGIDQVDVVIDLRDIRTVAADEKIDLVTDFLALQPAINQFRSIAVIGSSAVKDVSAVEKDSVGSIFRNELKIWAYLRADLPLEADLIFGDYGVIHPDFAADDLPVGGTANCKIRYTAGRNILIFRGHQRAGDSGQPHLLAQAVRNHAAYRGRPYSSGDAYIDDVASYTTGPGHLGNWVCADMSHHLTFTARQIARLVEQVNGSMTEAQIDALLDGMS
ncbi:beta family protein [Burkholderia ubonensis]|uniref:beta family protein n=1 Tax=Burkholderia ubonensis TaxID=101571 RepID=UPI000B0D4E54|nr:beta family protein [Burkholderia ubonensis]